MAWVRCRTSKSRVRNTRLRPAPAHFSQPRSAWWGAERPREKRLRIGHVILLALDERLHVRRRDQLHRVAELGNLPPPIVSTATGLHGHRAGRERCQEREELAAAQLLAKDNSSRAVGSVQLKDVLGEIQSDGAHLVHGRLLEWPATPSLWHTKAAGGVHTITATLAGATSDAAKLAQAADRKPGFR